MVVHMTILHATPILMTSLNVYFTDIKLLKADWKLAVWHGFFYMFANKLGTFDMDHAVYPIIDWKSYPMTIAVFCLAIAIMSGVYYCHCIWLETHLKRRGEK